METPLERVRLARGLTIAEVAAVVKTSGANYWRVEKGEQSPRKKLLDRIYKYFGGEVTEMQILYPERFMQEGANE